MPKCFRSCSRNMKVSTVWGTRRMPAGKRPWVKTPEVETSGPGRPGPAALQLPAILTAPTHLEKGLWPKLCGLHRTVENTLRDSEGHSDTQESPPGTGGHGSSACAQEHGRSQAVTSMGQKSKSHTGQLDRLLREPTRLALRHWPDSTDRPCEELLLLTGGWSKAKPRPRPWKSTAPP